ncbi:MAG: hypothetical protein D4R74_01765 [Betaproteobacteria bacterium]|nr:MAG: hypothetical protein D4R74_01765 [Betaproteobacteria bacterium]
MNPQRAVTSLVGLVLLAGCAGTTVGVRTSAAPSMRGSAPVVGTSYNSAAIHAELSPNAYFGLLFFGAFAAGVEDKSRLRGPSWRDPPQLAEDRTVVERDCSLPMEAPSANLRCK